MTQSMTTPNNNENLGVAMNTDAANTSTMGIENNFEDLFELDNTTMEEAMNTDAANTSTMDIENNFEDLFEFEDDLNFGNLFSYDEESPRPSDKVRKQSAVESILASGDTLAQEYKDYETEFVTRGNKVLYGLLTKIYKYALEIDFSNSTLKEEILAGMRKHLKDIHGVKTTMNTPWLTTVIKYIVKSDRQTASNYSRVLRVAHMNDIAVKDLTAYIEKKGGIGSIQASDDEIAKRNNDKNENKKRLEFMRKAFWIHARKTKHVLTYSGELTEFSKSPLLNYSDSTVDAKFEKAGEFTVFITGHDLANDEYRIIYACEFDQKFENGLLNYISKRTLVSTDKLEKFVTQQEIKSNKAENSVAEFNDDESIMIEATFTDVIAAPSGELSVINDGNIAAANSELVNPSKVA
jgi:hypothetical protein